MTETATATRRRLRAGHVVQGKEILARATEQAARRGLSDLLIVDADAHHYETETWLEIARRIEDPVLRRMAIGGNAGNFAPSPVKANSLMPGGLPIDIDMSGRIPRYGTRGEEKSGTDAPRDVLLTWEAMDAMGIDTTILFPNNMPDLGLHPVVQVEVAVARAYALWMTEEILPASRSRIKTLIYLPFNDPQACVRLVEEFGDRPGVVGFLVGSIRHNAVHDNAYMPLYGELERRGLPLGFHGSWDPAFQTHLLNNMLAVHALGFPYHIMLNMTNWVINGMPERFPGLRTVWIEGGLAYIPFLMQRLDHEYLMRTSEAPLLRKRPSEYIREFFFTSQPLEVPTQSLDPLKSTFALINAETQLLYASDYPHWDFDLPSRIYDLPFLSEPAKRKILGENASNLFQLDRR